MPIYNPSLQSLSAAEVQRYAGMKEAHNFPPAAITAAVQEGRLLAEAKSSWEIFPYDSATSTILAERKIELTATSIKRHLQASQHVVVLAVTIGELLEKTSEHYFAQGSYSHALLLDAAGTTAVEAAADQLEAFIRQQYAQKGFICTRRFSPGYGNWDIRFQPEILRLANAGQVNITSTESCMLLPRKSVTAVIGLQPTYRQQKLQSNSTCSTCSLTNCLSRREKRKDETN
ncbi:vitamin B12 dependent-methionine synthase activation domain-containing protein [Azotosporobacter soli]|uniref:vitamin B12 dependent-methionine synthase activation domain-containing protein n=1 Tax=Azotosporobacter soli TaxID=3055040 RepID=UPI0031FEE1BB